MFEIQLFREGGRLPPMVAQKMGGQERLMFEKSEGRKFSEMDDDEVRDGVGKILPYIFHDIGIHSKPTPYEATRLMQTIRRYFNDFTFGEIKLAFEFLISGDLDRWLPKDRKDRPEKEHYQLFSMEYALRVLKAYRLAKESVVMKAQMLALPEEAPPDPEKIRVEYLEVLDMELERFRESGNISFINPAYVLEFLIERGLYKGGFVVTLEDKMEGVRMMNEIGVRKKREIVEAYGRAYKIQKIIKEIFEGLKPDFKFKEGGKNE